MRGSHWTVRLFRGSALEFFLVVFIFLFGYGAGQAYLNAARTDRTAVAGIELLYGPAIMMAYGYGFIHPDIDRYPEMQAFLRNQQESLSREALPDSIQENPSEVADYHRYLLYAVAVFWRVLGVSWRSLEPLLALMAGWCAVAIYGLMRLGMRRLFALPLTLVVAASPGMLCTITDLRDFSKAPFILTTLLALGWLLKRPFSFRSTIIMAAGVALLAGVGMGFRQDILIFVPPAVLLLLIAGVRMKNASLARRLLPCILFIVCFILAGAPMLTRMEGAAGPDHHIVQGFSRKHVGNLGVVSPNYELLASWTDNYVFASLYSYWQRTGKGNKEHFGYNSPGHEAASRQWLFDVALHFPGDLLARGYGATLRMVQYVNAYPPTSTTAHPWIRQTLPIHQAFAKHMHRFGILYAVLALLLISAHRVHLAVGTLIFVLYACGYVSLQFEYRHGFHFTFLPFWIMGFLFSTFSTLAFQKIYKKAPNVPWKPALMKAVLTGILALPLLFLPLWLLRSYQARELSPMIDAGRDLALKPVQVRREEHFGWTRFALHSPTAAAETIVAAGAYSSDQQSLWGCLAILLDDDRKSGHTRTRYFAIVFDALPAGSPLLLVYTTPIPWNNFTQLVTIANEEEEATVGKYLFPVYELFMHNHGKRARNHFTGIALPSSLADRFSGLYEVENFSEQQFLMHLTYPVSEENIPGYQKINLSPDPLDYYRPDVGEAALLGYAQTVEKLKGQVEAIPLYQAALLVSGHEQFPFIASLLYEMGELTLSLEAVQEYLRAHPEKGSEMTRLLLTLGQAFAEQERLQEALDIYEQARLHVPAQEYATLLIGDFFYAQGNWEKARGCYSDYLRHHPESEDGLARLRQTITATPGHGEAITTLQEIVATQPESIPARLQLAGALEEAGQYEEAAARAAEVLRQHPNHEDALLLIAGLHPLAGNMAAGLSVMNTVMESHKHLVHALVERILSAARTLINRGQKENAAALCRALAAYPLPFASDYLDTGQLLMDAGDGGTASALFKQWIAHPEAGYRAATLLNECHVAQQYETIALWRELTREYPSLDYLRLFLAVALFKAGEYEESSTLFEDLKLIAAYEEQVAPYLSILKMLSDDPRSGIQSLDAHIREYPEKARMAAALLIQVADHLLDRDALTDARLLTDKALQLDPASESAWITLIHLLGRLSDTEALLKAGRNAFIHLAKPSIFPNQMAAVLNTTCSEHDRLALWQFLSENHPDIQSIQEQYAIALADAGLYREATPILERLLNEAPDRSDIHLVLAKALLITADFNEGLVLLQQTVDSRPELRPQAAAAALQAADVLLREEDMTKAIRLYESAIPLQPDDLNLKTRLAALYRDSGRVKEAMTLYEEVLHSSFESSLGSHAAAEYDRLLKQHEQPNTRIETWRRMSEEQASHWLPQYYLMLGLMDAGQLKEALSVCDQISTRYPENAAFSLSRAVLLFHLGDTEKGHQALNTLADIPGDLDETISHLAADAALLLLCKGDYASAQQLLQMLLNVQPDNLWHRVRLGEVYAAQTDYRAALDQFRSVLIEFPDSPYTATQMDRVYQLMNIPEERVQMWSTLAEQYPESQVLKRHLNLARSQDYENPLNPCFRE